MTGYGIHAARSSDLDDIVRLYSLSADEMEDKFQQPRQAGHIEKMLDAMEDTHQICLVATYLAEKIGYLFWSDLGQTRGTALGLGTFVLRDHRKKGIGNDLTEEAIIRARAKGWRSVTGVVSVGNDAGMARCKKAGFREVGIVVSLAF